MIAVEGGVELAPEVWRGINAQALTELANAAAMVNERTALMMATSRGLTKRLVELRKEQRVGVETALSTLTACLCDE